MEQVTFQFTGTSPMFHHNVRLVDPLDPLTKQLAQAVADAKAKKTDATHMTVRRAEFEAGMYFDDKIGPYAPSTWVLKSIRDVAALTKKGKGIERGVIVLGPDKIPVSYKGPRTIEELWEKKFYDVRAVGVGQNRTMRCRPMFTDWSIKVTLGFIPDFVSRTSLIGYTTQAGAFMGIGDARNQRLGRFDVTTL